jgi:HAD superfamily hydrolase (TIGR01509 family)
MIPISKVTGAIFDVDDTLLDNKPGVLGKGLHERSRLAAFRTVGQLHNLPALANISLQDNLDSFRTAPTHSLPGAVWNHLWKSGLVDSEVVNSDHPLLQEIVAKKNELHAVILREEGEAVPGAVAFVRRLASHGLGDKMAIASSAIRRDIHIFLDKMELRTLFPEERIMSLESATHTKPHPELFDLAFASLGLPESARATTLAFEDDPRGVMSAKAAGLYACAITTRYTRTELESLEVAPDVVADSYQEFAELLGLAKQVQAA